MSLITLSYLVSNIGMKLLVYLESKSFPLLKRSACLGFSKSPRLASFFLVKKKLYIPLLKMSAFWFFKLPHLFFLLNFFINNFMSGILSHVQFFKSFHLFFFWISSMYSNLDLSQYIFAISCSRIFAQLQLWV